MEKEKKKMKTASTNPILWRWKTMNRHKVGPEGTSLTDEIGWPSAKDKRYSADCQQGDRHELCCNSNQLNDETVTKSGK